MTRLLRKRTIVPLVLCMMLGISQMPIVFGGQNSDEEFHQRYDLNPGAIVSVRNTSGRITITGWKNNYADVRAIKRGRRSEDFSRVRVDVTNSTTRLDIRTIYERGRNGVDIDYDIQVPFNVSIDSARSNSGDVSVTGVQGYTIAGSNSGTVDIRNIGDYAKIDSNSGDIQAIGVKGKVTISGSSGTIHVRDAGPVTMNTNSGDLTVTNATGNVEMHTQSGGISATQVRGDLIARSSSGDLRTSDITGNARLEALSGEVTVDKVTGSVSASSVSGKVRVTGGSELIEVRSTSDDVIVTGAKGRIEATSTSGNLRLENIDSADVSANTTSGDVFYSGALKDGGRYSFDSFSGTVRLIFPPGNCGFLLSAKSFNGDIESDFQIKVSEIRQSGTNRRIEGTVGGGCARVKASSYSGSILIRSSSNTPNQNKRKN